MFTSMKLLNNQRRDKLMKMSVGNNSRDLILRKSTEIITYESDREEKLENEKKNGIGYEPSISHFSSMYRLENRDSNSNVLSSSSAITTNKKMNNVREDATSSRRLTQAISSMKSLTQRYPRNPQKNRLIHTNIPSARLAPSSAHYARPIAASVIVATLALVSCLSINQTQAFLSSSSSSSAAAAAASNSGANAAAASPTVNENQNSSPESPSLASSILSAIQEASKSSSNPSPNSSSNPNSNSHDRSSGIMSSIQDAVSAVAAAAAPVAASALVAAIAPNSSHSPASSPSSPLTSQTSPSSSPSSSSSIVASLSSAVASAAAAAAVAAAKNSLSGDDARSILSSAGHHSDDHTSLSLGASKQQHQPRSPGLQLALKLADAIPEVPYSILHNMKKIDHAAPFYNVGSRTNNPGSPKESIGLLGGALASASSAKRFTGAAEHLSSLFKSPLWKRMTESYKDFTSEFRTLFRAPATANTMKGPTTSATTKLLRDISVPALLMLIASVIPSDQWRPVRTRRKSLLQADMLQAIDPLTGAASSEGTSSISAVPMFTTLPQTGYNMMQQQQQYQPQIQAREFSPIFNQQVVQQQQQQQPSQQPQQQAANSQTFRQADINLQPMEISSASKWIQTQQQQLMKRLGEISPTMSSGSVQSQVADKQHETMKPVESSISNDHHLHPIITTSPFSSLFSSLTSGLMSSERLNKLLNGIGMGAEKQESNPEFKMGNLADENKLIFLMPRRDQLSDRHRYSLLDNEVTEEKSPSGIEKPFLLSGASHALSSLFTSNSAPLESGLSSSYRGEAASAPFVFARQPTLINSKSHQFHMIGDKTINHRADSIPLIRRNQLGGSEHRELSQLIPQSWREVVKRTVNSVQQQATTQWRSIEGQLTNWVQDKLKTIPAASLPPTPTPTPSTSSSSSSSSSSPAASPAAPISSIFSTVSSTAMNIFGLGGNRNTSTQPNSSSSEPSTGSIESESNSQIFKNKNDSANRNKLSTPKGTLIGVANLIVNTLTNRQPSASSSTSSQTTNNGSKVKDTIIITDSGASSSNKLSHYPTLTGTQPSQLQAESSPSPSSGTASTVAGITGKFMAA